ncbi:MAG: hypothetical protein V7642_5236, partial [Burkholderiales bacterium]
FMLACVGAGLAQAAALWFRSAAVSNPVPQTPDRE